MPENDEATVKDLERSISKAIMKGKLKPDIARGLKNEELNEIIWKFCLKEQCSQKDKCKVSSICLLAKKTILNRYTNTKSKANKLFEWMEEYD